MEIKELALILKKNYENSLPGEQVATIHLFGIEYGQEIRKRSYAAREIVNESGLRKSYSAELSKGIKLSKFVKLK